MHAGRRIAGQSVLYSELQHAVGQRLADICGTEAGYVLSGAAAGLTAAAAAVLAGHDLHRIARLPHLHGERDEILVIETADDPYSQALRLAGAELTWLDSPDDIDQASTARTAAVFIDIRDLDAQRHPLARTIAAARARALPVIVDASLALPPRANLTAIPATGATLTVFTAAKTIGGPANSGFVVGRRDLIDSIALQHQDHDLREQLPGGHAHPRLVIGILRGFKVAPCDLIGTIVAVEDYLALDEHRDTQRRHDILTRLADRLGNAPGVATRILGHVPTLEVAIEPAGRGPTAREIHEQLLAGQPSIYVPQHQNMLWINISSLDADEITPALDAVEAAIARPQR